MADVWKDFGEDTYSLKECVVHVKALGAACERNKYLAYVGIIISSAAAVFQEYAAFH